MGVVQIPPTVSGPIRSGSSAPANISPRDDKEMDAQLD